MFDQITFVLIHSPLVGPLTWELVRHELARRGVEAVTPAVTDRPTSALPFWKQHAESAASQLSAIPQSRSIVWVAHSGAGPLLPVIRHLLPNPLSAYMFIDAGIPHNGFSRLDLLGLESQTWAEQFHQTLLQGARFPTWSSDDLRAIIPDDELRRKMIAEINPRALPFFTESIPVFAGWPDGPCAYIQLSAPYDSNARQARQLGWLVQVLSAGHFHMLVDPSAMAEVIIQTVQASLELTK